MDIKLGVVGIEWVFTPLCLPVSVLRGDVYREKSRGPIAIDVIATAIDDLLTHYFLYLCYLRCSTL